MQTKNIVSNNLKEFVLQLEAAVKEGYAVVEESVDFQAGYWKCFAQKDIVMTIDPEKSHKISDRGKEAVINSLQESIVLDAKQATEMLDNPSEPNETLKEIIEDKPVPPPTVEFVAKKRGKKQ